MSQLTTGANLFRKATKQAAKLRMALTGPPGAGKTYTALLLALALAEVTKKKTAVVDTEKGSASKYADLFDFDVLELEGSFHPNRYIEAIRAAEQAGYGQIVIDSLSHAWIGTDGGLDLHDKAVARQKTKNSYTAWADVTPHHNALVQALVQSRCHLIATMRTKVEYAQEKDDRTGKTAIRKIGTAPLMRDGVEYEFDIVGDMDLEHTLVVTKSRCAPLADKVFSKPGADFARPLLAWLGSGPMPAVEERGAEPPKSNGNGKGIGGAELAKRIKDKDASLAAEGRCKAGEFLNHVVRAGLGQGFSPDLAQWPKTGLAIAVAATKEFEKQHPVPPAREAGDEPEDEE